MYGALDTSVSGMIAQRTRLEVAQANIANKDAMLNAQGEYDPYLRRHVMLAAGGGVRGESPGVRVREIVIDPDSLRPKYDPSSPHADEDGYVMVPDIESFVEQATAQEALRAYEANVMAADASRSMMAQALRLIG